MPALPRAVPRGPAARLCLASNSVPGTRAAPKNPGDLGFCPLFCPKTPTEFSRSVSPLQVPMFCSLRGSDAGICARALEKRWSLHLYKHILGLQAPSTAPPHRPRAVPSPVAAKIPPRGHSQHAHGAGGFGFSLHSHCRVNTKHP